MPWDELLLTELELVVCELELPDRELELLVLLPKELWDDCELLDTELDDSELENSELDDEDDEDPPPPHATNEIRQNAQNPLAIYEDSVIIFIPKAIQVNDIEDQCFKLSSDKL